MPYFKKIFIVTIFLFGAFSLFSQTISVEGYVTDIANGLPVQDQLVVVDIDEGGMQQEYLFTTNEVGYFFDDSIPVVSQGAISAMTIDCYGNEIIYQDFFSPGISTFIFDFQICTDSTSSGDCTNFFWFTPIDSTTYEFNGEALPIPANDYIWDFGDGQTAVGQQVVHSFDPLLGDWFAVTLYTYTYSPGTDTCVAFYMEEVWINNSIDCENFFWYETNDNLTFDFFGESLPLPADDYLWDFGDGNTGFGPLMTHTYEPNGVEEYMVTLTTITYDPGTNDSCFASSNQLVTAGTLINCEAYFIAQQDSLDQLTVQFSDLSTGLINYWFWDFGDGMISEEQNPTHNYTYPGSYLVCLTIFSDSLGYSCSDMFCSEVILDYTLNSSFLTVLDTLSGMSNQYSFLDLSFGNPDVWSWDFGDGNFSNVQHPVHQYDESGVYEVCLEVTKDFTTGPSITNQFCQTITTPFYYDFGGMAFLGDHPMNNVNGDTTVLDTGIAYIYRKYQDVIIPVDTNLFYQYGYYWFSDVREGDYIIKVGLTEDSYHYNDYLTAYFESTISWQDANVLNLSDTNYYVNIKLEEIEGIESGPGSISGSLSVEGSCPMAPVISSQLIILLDESNIPVTFTSTGINGEFEFNNIPFGNYKLYPELTGLSVQIEMLTIDIENLQIEDLYFELNCIPSIGIDEFNIESIIAGDIYPNPIQQKIDIEINTAFSQCILLNIFNVQGKKVWEQKYQLNPGEQLISIDAHKLPDGFYLLSVGSEELHYPIIRKFIK